MLFQYCNHLYISANERGEMIVEIYILPSPGMLVVQMLSLLMMGGFVYLCVLLSKALKKYISNKE